MKNSFTASAKRSVPCALLILLFYGMPLLILPRLGTGWLFIGSVASLSLCLLIRPWRFCGLLTPLERSQSGFMLTLLLVSQVVNAVIVNFQIGMLAFMVLTLGLFGICILVTQRGHRL
jgi:hypothetical protein